MTQKQFHQLTMAPAEIAMSHGPHTHSDHRTSTPDNSTAWRHDAATVAYRAGTNPRTLTLDELAYLQRTIGNQAVGRLLAESLHRSKGGGRTPTAHTGSDSHRPPTNPIQRVVSLGGAFGFLDEATDVDFQKLIPAAQKIVRDQIDDPDKKYEYPDRVTFYAYAAGDASKAPKVTPIPVPQMKEAKRRKNRRAWHKKHTRIGSPTDNPKFHAPEQKGTLPVWYPMSTTGMDKTSISWTRNPHMGQHELFSAKNLNPAQQTELNTMSLTVVEEKGTRAMDFLANVGPNVASSFTDTDIKSRPTGTRDSDMGGWTNADFKEGSVGASGTHVTDRSAHYSSAPSATPTLTIGHQQAYADTITDPSQKVRITLGSGKVENFTTNIKTTDQEQEPMPGGLPTPSVMSPEQYDLGQHGRRTQIEAKARKERGAYFEANIRTPDSGSVKGGLDIPGEKVYARVSKDRKKRTVAKFNQYSPVYAEKQAAGGWEKLMENKKVGPNDIPQQTYYESDEDISYDHPSSAPSTPQLLSEFVEEDTYVSPTPLMLGEKLGVTYKGHSDWIVDAVLKDSPPGATYKLTRTKGA